MRKITARSVESQETPSQWRRTVGWKFGQLAPLSLAPPKFIAFHFSGLYISRPNWVISFQPRRHEEVKRSKVIIFIPKNIKYLLDQFITT